MAKRGPEQLPREERFWARVDKSSECWEWTGARAVRGGYGAFYDNDGRNRRAHRVAWEMTYGLVPDGLVVGHQCDNPPCVRPDHLYLAAQKVNVRDCYARGRGKSDTKGQPRAKLDDDLVRWIRREVENGASRQALAEQLGVKRLTIDNVVTHRSWRHVA